MGLNKTGPYRLIRRSAGAGMRCPRCGANNSAGHEVLRAMRRSARDALVPSCGSSNPPDHRYCGQCGALLAEPGLQDSASPEPYTPKSDRRRTRYRREPASW